MERRHFIKAAAVGGTAVMIAEGLSLGQDHFPVQVDQDLWKGINRLKNPENETVLEKLHVPVITAPEEVKTGEIFEVDVVIGKELHPMGPKHWIEYLQLSIGNEPAGTITYRSHGYLKPVTRFAVFLDESLQGKPVSLVVTLKCNLHGLWQHYKDVKVT